MTDMLILEIIEKHLPLSIEHATFQHGCLSLAGADWSFDCWSPWRVVRGRELLASSHAPSPSVHHLVGRQLASIASLSKDSRFDPVFGMDDQTRLEVFSVQKD